jgi:DNA-binding NtrC family response regulator
LSFLSSLRKELIIAIVDDDPIFCRALQGILGERGYEVLARTDASQWSDAVDMDTGIILLDLKLDHISGLEILKHIRAQHPNLPVILMTGYREEMSAVIEAAQPFNVHTFLYKPFKIDQLIRILAEIRRQELKAVFNDLERNAL